ncbi:MAG: choice-of-anchor tandem repeat GloVer-containing protein, partial [Verrucomicrobiota bacterium]
GSGGSGTVFSLSTNGNNFTVLKSFSALNDNTNSDGGNPAAALILSNGVLYGTTAYGGALGDGTIFRLNTNGTGFTNLYTFSNGSDGATPAGRLLLSGNILYGTAQEGGDFSAGTVFSLNPNGTGFVTLHSFSGSDTDGAYPCAGLVMSGGQLFGTTPNGDSGNESDDGTVFRVDINGNNFTNLYSFSGDDGSASIGELVLSGSTLYGTTSMGGAGGIPYGTIFKINTDGGGFGTVVNFDWSNGRGPTGGAVLSGGVLYGVTGLGGTGNSGLGNGVVYSVTTDGTGLTAQVVFADFNGAATPGTGLMLAGSTLFGSTLFGGAPGEGTLFEIGTNGSGYAQVHEFSIADNNGANPDGTWPDAVMVLSGSTLYGTTRYGGTNGSGAVFKLNADGTGFTNLYSFHGAQQGSPQAALVASGTALYGTTASGGSNSCGAVFKINTDGSGFTNLYSFKGTDGKMPLAGLTLSGSVLYGTTYYGGAATGTVFQVNTDGSHFTNIYSFTGLSDGASPGGVLVLTNGVLYGATYHGGTNGLGMVFKVNTDRTGFTVLHTFVGTNVYGAGAGDLLLSGNTLYGSAAYYGSSNAGCIFKLDTSGSNYTVLYNFTGGSDGANPNTTLVLLGNTLYGTAESGGLSGHGTVFSLALSSVVNPIPLNIRGIGNAVVLTWGDPAFLLQAAPLVTDTYTNVPGASSPYTNAISGATKFYRLQAN